jgi:hypothetical protein
MGEGVLYDTGINVIFVLYHFGEKHYLEKKERKMVLRPTNVFRQCLPVKLPAHYFGKICDTIPSEKPECTTEID